MACRDCVWWEFLRLDSYDKSTRWGRCGNEEGRYMVSLETDTCPQFKERTDGDR